MSLRHFNIPGIILLILSLLPFAAESADRYTPLPPDLDGSMMPLDPSRFTQTLVLPDSLEPVYALYVARHGSRYLSGPKKVTALADALQKGVNTGTLSTEGEAFFIEIKDIISANDDNWGDLTALGAREQRVMGKRVFEMLTPLRQPEAGVRAIASYVPRCSMTMYEFCNQLARCNDRISVATAEGPRFSPLLCFFSSDREYAEYREHGDWQHVYNDFMRRHVSAEPARRLFTRTALTENELREMTMQMYEVLKANRAAGLSAPTTRWMSAAEYRGCWEADNLRHYLRNSVSSLSTLPARAAAPLLIDMINRTDQAVTAKTLTTVMNGYFGHAETLMPLLSLIKIPGCFALPRDFDSLDKEWRVQDITPLGASLLMLVSRSRSGVHYVSMQLNGRTVRPMPGLPDIVPWSELKAYWNDLMEAYGVDTHASAIQESTELNRPRLY